MLFPSFAKLVLYGIWEPVFFFWHCSRSRKMFRATNREPVTGKFPIKFQSSIDANVASVLRNGDWHWKPTQSEELVTVQSQLSDIHLGDSDNPVWTVARKGTYVSSETWNFLRKKKPKVTWWPLIWFPYAIPKQAFLMWLAVRNRLTTGDRLTA